MSKSRILKTALTEISKGIKKVDLGDLTRKPNVSERIKAIDRMVGDAGKKVADNVDDWGWKGGKPGEITGGDWTEKWDEIQYAQKHVDPDNSASVRMVGNKNAKLFDRAYKQLKPLGVGDEDEIENTMAVFSSMEKANIPRRYTGKIYKATGDFISNNNAYDWISHHKFIRGKTNDNIAGFLAEQLQPLNNKQRLEAIKLIPEWSRSLDNLGETAKEITKMTSDQKETFLALLPEWTESMEDLVKAAKTL